MPTTYVRQNFPLPAVNAEWLNINTTTTRYSAYVPITPISRPSGNFFCYWDSTGEVILKRLYVSIATSLWHANASLLLANPAGFGIAFPIGNTGFTNHWSGSANANMSDEDIWLTWIAAIGTLTQARIQITLSRSNFLSGCDVNVNVNAGNLAVFYPSTTGPVVVDAQKVQCGPPMFSWPGSTNDPTRLRYNITQTHPGNIDWDGTIPGSSDIRRFQ